MVWPRPAGTSHRSWRILGFPLHIDSSWYFIVAFMTWTLAGGYFPSAYPGLPEATYWIMGFASALLLFVCVLLHELGHALTARHYGIHVAGMTLFIFGGVASIAEEPHRPFVELKIALAGPLVSVVIAACCFYVSHVMPVETPVQLVALAILSYLALINTAILVFNLLPGFPLDGGRVLRAIVWAATGSLRKATRVAASLGAAFGLCLMALGVWALVKGSWFSGFWYLMLGFFLRDAARGSLRRL